MKKPELKYIGQQITIKSLRDFVLDSSLSETDTILLNPENMGNIVLEYRRTYNESISIPYLISGVLIEEDSTDSIPFDRVGIIKDGTQNDIKPNSMIDYYRQEFFKKR